MIALNQHLCFKLYVASRAIMRGYAVELAPLDLTFPKYIVLVALGESDGSTVGQLATTLNLDFGTASPLVKALEASGFVERRRGKRDERTTTCHLTASGRVALEKAMATAYDLFCRTEMSVEAITALRDQMDDYILRCHRLLDQQKEKHRDPEAPARPSRTPRRRAAGGSGRARQRLELS